MASEMPVLPEVGSRMVQPGFSSPSSSAFVIIRSAGRSLIEPVGLRSSSLAHSRTCGAGEKEASPTTGVSPRASIKESYRAMMMLRTWEGSAAGDCGQDRHRAAVGHLRVEATGEAHVLVVDVDVDEPVQSAVGDQAVLDAGVVGLEVGDDLLQ